MIRLQDLSDAQQKALLSMGSGRTAHKPRRTLQALERLGFVTYAPSAPGIAFTLTHVGSLLIRQHEARHQYSSDFSVDETVGVVVWLNSRNQWTASIEQWVVTTIAERTPGHPRGYVWAMRQGGFCGFYPGQLIKLRDDEIAAPIVVSSKQDAPAVHPALLALRALNVDALDPISAITKLYELKRMVD